MGKQSWRIIFSIFLIVLGVVALLGNLNLLPFAFASEQIVWMSLFGVVGLGFLAAFLSGPNENWWAAIPALTLIALAMLIGLPIFWAPLGGAMFLGMIGLSFWVIFAMAPRERWWAMIPGGTLASLAAVTLVAEWNGMASGGVLFIGLALTFLAVYLVMHMAWALWPAGILGIMGALILMGSGTQAALLFPALLIVIGGLLIYRSARARTQ